MTTQNKPSERTISTVVHFERLSYRTVTISVTLMIEALKQQTQQQNTMKNAMWPSSTHRFSFSVALLCFGMKDRALEEGLHSGAAVRRLQLHLPL